MNFKQLGERIGIFFVVLIFLALALGILYGFYTGAAWCCRAFWHVLVFLFWDNTWKTLGIIAVLSAIDIGYKMVEKRKESA